MRRLESAAAQVTMLLSRREIPHAVYHLPTACDAPRAAVFIQPAANGRIVFENKAFHLDSESSTKSSAQPNPAASFQQRRLVLAFAQCGQVVRRTVLTSKLMSVTIFGTHNRTRLDFCQRIFSFYGKSGSIFFLRVFCLDRT